MVSKSRLARLGAWVAWAIAVLAFLFEIPLLIANAPTDALSIDPHVSPEILRIDPSETNASVPPAVLAIEDFAFVAVATLSLLILRKQPSNPVGWAMMLVGVTFPVEGFFAELTTFSLRTWGEGGLALFAGWVSRWIWIGSGLAVPLILLYYPDGKLPSPPWRWVVRYIWIVAAIVFTVSAFDPEPIEEFGGLPNPIGVDFPDVLSPVSMVAFTSIFIMPLLGAISLVPRYRRSSGVERQQMKLIAWVAIVALIFFLVSGFELIFEVGPVADAIANTVFTVFVGASITAGIIRYRVFEIDRIISRTVSYALVVGIIGLGYLGVVTVVSGLLPSQDALVVAGSTLAAAAVFNPLRRRIQSAADRKFNRSGYEAGVVAEEFAAELRDAHSVDEIGQRWHDAVVETMEPAIAGLWLNHDGSQSAPGR